MSSWENVYNTPEKYGLVIVAEAAKEPCYDFDMVVVFRHEDTGHLYWAADSGCSCPSPFEDYHSLDSLTRLTSIDQLISPLDNISEFGLASGLKFLSTVREALL